MSEQHERWIDLRSDTVTQPSAAMRAAMAAAPVGDDVYGDDPTVNRLQDFAAELFGFEAGLFAPTGTQTNLIALMTHCGRGDEYLVGQEAHTYKYEGGGAAVLGSIQPQPIANQPDGSIAVADIAAYIKPDDMHFARTRLLALENTIGGRVLPQDYVLAATEAGACERPGDPPGRRAHLQRRRQERHLACVRRCRFRHRVGVPVEGPGRAGRLGAAGPQGLHRAGQALAQDAGRRHAPGRRDRGGGPVRARAQCRAPGRRPPERRRSLGRPGADRAAEGDHAADQYLLRRDPGSRRAQRCAKRLAQQGIRASIGAHTRLVTHLDVSKPATCRSTIAAFKDFFKEWQR
jgi:threonine aldolase